MQKKQLIVNADDFGIGQRVTDGIIECHVDGIVTSTTLMANMPAAEYACQLAKSYPKLGVGVHLNLTRGVPLSDPGRIPDLIAPDGSFLTSREIIKKLWGGARISKQIELEFSEQVQRSIDLGAKPTHCDSHHGIHKRPAARTALIAVARKFGISRARNQSCRFQSLPAATYFDRLRAWMKNTTRLPASLYDHLTRRQMVRAGIILPDRKVSRSQLVPLPAEPEERMVVCVNMLAAGTTEIVFHPGLPDTDADDDDSQREMRAVDYQVAMSKHVRSAINEQPIELISFRNLLDE